MRRALDLCWFLLSWAAFVAIAAAVLAALYFYNRVDEQIRILVEARIAEVYPELHVSVRSAKLIERRGFEVRGISISDPAGGRPRELLFAQRLTIACRPTLEDLIEGKLQVQTITVRGLRLQAMRDGQGQWDVRQLLRPPKLQLDPPPRIVIEGGSIDVIDTHATPPSQYSLKDVNLSLVPEPGSTAASPRYRMDASFSGDHLHRSTLAGVLLPKEGRFALRGHIPRILLSPELRQALPHELASRLTALGELRGGAAADFTLSHNAQPDAGWHYAIDAQLLDGLVADPRLPEPLTDVQAAVHVDPKGVQIARCSARYGSAVLELTSQAASGANTAHSTIRGTVRDLHLDTRFASLLPERYQQSWRDFLPRGLVDATFQLTRTGDTWQPDVHLMCRDVSIEWRGFPLLCRNVQGPLHWSPAGVTFDLKAQAQDEPVTITGEVRQPGPHWTGWIHVQTHRPQSLTAAFLAAMPAAAQPFFQSLAPQGKISGHARYFRQDASKEPGREIAVTLTQVDVRHQSFPYPLRDITGRAFFSGNTWRFEKLRGVNDSAVVTCEGSWSPGPQGQLSLNFHATQVPLDEELRQALQPDAQEIWAQLRPRGVLDEVRAQVTHTHAEGMRIDLELQQHAGGDAGERRDIDLHPVAFPYRLEELTGIVRYRDRRIEFQKMRARHDQTMAGTSGHALVQPNGDWQIALDDLVVDRLHADRDLIQALPPSLGAALDRLQVQGPAHLRGQLSFYGNLRTPQPLRVHWNMAVNVDHVHLDCGLPLREVAGTLQLQGAGQPGKFFSRGRIDLESVVAKDVYVSQVQGPIWFNDREVRLGRWAESPSESEPAPPITGRLFGGQLSADVQVLLDESGRFVVHADLADGNLLHAVREITTSKSPVRGRADAQVQLTGTRAGMHTWQGRGSLQVTQANLYELPFILTLLKTLRSGSVDRSAFDTGHVSFRVQGEHVYLDRIDLIGDSMTLKGVGELSTQREVNLDFYTILGRENAYVPAVRKFLGMANSRFLQIHVNGPIDNPTMVREVLPGLNETLEQLFPESVPAQQMARTGSE